MTKDGERFIEIVEEAAPEARVRSYSGRGMYGKQCIGVVTEEPELLGIRMACAAADDTEREDLLAIFERGTCTDQMGRRATVVYFPKLQWDAKTMHDEGEE